MEIITTREAIRMAVEQAVAATLAVADTQQDFLFFRAKNALFSVKWRYFWDMKLTAKREVSKSFELPNGRVVVERYNGSGKYVCAIRGYSPWFGDFEEVNDFLTMANRDEMFEYFDEARAIPDECLIQISDRSGTTSTTVAKDPFVLPTYTMRGQVAKVARSEAADFEITFYSGDPVEMETTITVQDFEADWICPGDFIEVGFEEGIMTVRKVD